MGRYQEFANYCTNHGFIVYGIDLVGHGKSLYQGHIKGYFGIFLDEEVEAEDEIQAKEEILYEILDNLANYIEIDVIEVDEDIDYDDEEE